MAAHRTSRTCYRCMIPSLIASTQYILLMLYCMIKCSHQHTARRRTLHKFGSTYRSNQHQAKACLGHLPTQLTWLKVQHQVERRVVVACLFIHLERWAFSTREGLLVTVCVATKVLWQNLGSHLHHGHDTIASGVDKVLRALVEKNLTRSARAAESTYERSTFWANWVAVHLRGVWCNMCACRFTSIAKVHGQRLQESVSGQFSFKLQLLGQRADHTCLALLEERSSTG